MGSENNQFGVSRCCGKEVPAKIYGYAHTCTPYYAASMIGQGLGGASRLQYQEMYYEFYEENLE